VRDADVVITGLGTLGSFGAGEHDLTEALAAGRLEVTELADPAGYRGRRAVMSAALCRDLPLDRWVDPGRGRRMSAPSRFAVAAAHLALADAGLPLHGSDETRSVALATTFGAGVFTERLLAEIVTAGPRTASPFLFTDCVANAPAAQVAIEVRAQGPNTTVVQREAGPLLAVIEGVFDLRARRVATCLAGHVDEIGVLVHAVLARLRALCPPDQDGILRPRPFDARRRGFVAGEGSTILVLETAAAARARGARVRARVAATIRGFDPTATALDWGQGADLLGERLRQGLRAHGIAPDSIDGVVSGACGSVRGDALEARVLRTAFGADLPPLFAPKAFTGEYGGGSLAAALLILNGARCADPTPDMSIDPELCVRVHGGALPSRAGRVLLSGLASGGAAAWIVLERGSHAQ